MLIAVLLLHPEGLCNIQCIIMQFRNCNYSIICNGIEEYAMVDKTCFALSTAFISSCDMLAVRKSETVLPEQLAILPDHVSLSAQE